MKRSSFVLAAVAAVAVLLAGPVPRASAATDPALIAPVDHLITAILAKDAKGLAAAYDASPSIVDEFAPFTWTGSGAPVAWARDFAALQRTDGITAPHVVRGTPQTANVSPDGRRAYLVVPTTFAYLMKGKPTKETGTWTFVLARPATGAPWRIASSTWGTTRTTP
jgi:hypothetical protein